MPLGNLQKGSVNIAGSTIEFSESDGDDMSTIIISKEKDGNPNQKVVYHLASPSRATAREWYDKIMDTARSASLRVNILLRA